MRKKLQQLGNNERYKFRGTVERKGKRFYNVHEIPTIMLKDVYLIDKDGNETYMTDHLWLDLGKSLQKINPVQNDIIEFYGRVKQYEKYNRLLEIKEYDYKISYPTKFKKIKKLEEEE